MATGSEKGDVLSKEFYDRMCDLLDKPLCPEDVLELQAKAMWLMGQVDELDEQLEGADNLIESLESLLAVAVAALRKEWSSVAPITLVSTAAMDVTAKAFCEHFGITEQQFAALKLGED